MRLLASGQLPPELAFAHPGFLRPCHQVRVPHDVYLHLYATHLARGADGRWRVFSDRSQTPSGAGYAVETAAKLARRYWYELGAPELLFGRQIGVLQ